MASGRPDFLTGTVETSEPVSWDTDADKSQTVGSSSGQLVAAPSGEDIQVVILQVEDGSYGIHIKFGTGAATTSSFYVPPGAYRVFTTNQRIAAIREAAATSDVNVWVNTGVFA